MDRLQTFLDSTAAAPPERDARHFRTWQRVSVQVQRDVRALAAATFFARESNVAGDFDRAFTMAVYAACQPCYGRRPMEFTYDVSDMNSILAAMRLIGRNLQARLAQISGGFQDPRLKRRFAPVWHLDIVNTVKRKPKLFRELLAREAVMIDALIELGIARDQRTARRFLKCAAAAARVLGIDSDALRDLVFQSGANNLADGGILENHDSIAARRPQARIGAEENGDHGRSDGGRQMTDPGVVTDIQACG